MFNDKTIAVVIPAYNEEQFVRDVIETVPEFVDRVYVVDDASTDSSWERIQACAADSSSSKTMTDGGTMQDSRIVPIRHQENKGVGGAIKTGYLQALVDRMDITAVMAGDGQMDPQFLQRLITPVVEGRADYSKGNRLVYREYRAGMSRWRLFGNSILSFLTKIASGYWKIMDPQNGYTAISLRALEQLNLDTLYDDYGFSNDILVKLNARRLRVADVAIPAKYGDETSYIRYRSFIPKTSWLLLKNFAWRLYHRYLLFDFHPLVLFYVIGTALLVFGVSLIGWVITRAVVAGEFILPLVSTIGILSLGSLFILFAMVFDMLANTDLEHQEFSP